MPSHSACQAPAARSCSCTSVPISSACVGLRAARAGQRRGSSRPGCACARMVEDPPRPSPAGSLTSPTSVCASSTTSSAILPSAPASVASADPSAATRTREVCHGSTGSARPRSPATRAHDLGAVRRPARRACRPRRRAARASAVARVEHEPLRLEHADEPRRGLEPERRRQRLLQQRARDHRRRAVRLGERGAGGGHPRDVGQHELERAPADEHRGRVDDVLAGRAVVHVAGGIAADGGAQRAHERLGRIADAASLARDAVAVEAARRDRPRRSPRPPSAGSRRPRPRPAASARSLSSMACSQARSPSSSSSACGREDRVEHRSDPLEPDVVLGEHRRGRAARRRRCAAARAAACRSNGSPSGERCSIDVIHHEKCSARQTRRRQVSE